MRLSDAEARARASAADHGVLSTLRTDGRIDAVPACFVLEGNVLAIAIERLKPKASGDLQRTRNLDANPDATFLVEGWDPDDWSRLWWVRLRLRNLDPEPATLVRLEDLLRRRYRQYESATFERLLVFGVGEVSGWAAS